MLTAVSSFVKDGLKTLQRFQEDRKRKLRLDKIREFQRDYQRGGEVVQAEFHYEVLSEEQLAAKSLEELDTLVAKVTEGQRYVESALHEVNFRKDAENPYHKFTMRYVAPRRSTWLECAKESGSFTPQERHCLVLLQILFYYDYLTEDAYNDACIALLGRPQVYYADPQRNSRAFDSAAELLDRPFIDVVLLARPKPKSYGFDVAQAAINEQWRKNPRSSRLARLKKEFQAKGVLAA